MSPGPLGCLKPPDTAHLDGHPFTAEHVEAGVVNVAVTCGFHWYDTFDAPIEIRDPRTGSVSYHLPDAGKTSLGTIRGGHCFPLEPMGAVKHNREAIRRFYNQKAEGACTGAGSSRALCIDRGGSAKYDLFWLYDQNRKHDGDPNADGSYVRSAGWVLKNVGHRQQLGTTECDREVGDTPVDSTLGISAYRWAQTVDLVLAALARPNADAVPLVNSWGDDYPAVVWMPVRTLERLLAESGEAMVFTPR